MPPLVPLEIKPIIQEKRKSHYEKLMRKFSESRKERCTYTKPENINIPEVERGEKKFCSGSTYEGSWNILGMNGFGFYSSSTGALYEGRIADGEFHGRGEMTFPSGDTVQGRWENGLLRSGNYYFHNGLQFESENWAYCRMPDRRFFIEVASSIQPVDNSYKTADPPPRVIPDGYYDTGDGFYDPLTKVVYKYENQTEIMRSPLDEENKWIVDHCRKAPDDVIGPQPELYEAFYEPTKYLDNDSSGSEVSWLTACDDEFLKRFEAMKERNSSSFVNSTDSNRQSMIKSRFFTEQTLSPTASTTTGKPSPISDYKGRQSIYDKRPKFFI